MTNEQLLRLIDAKIASDPEFGVLVAARDCPGMAAALSAGRQKLVPTEIGSGTILATLGDGGGAFLDALVTLGEANRNVYWTMDLIRQGRLRIDLPATRAGMQALAQAVPSLAPAVTALLTLGYADDPIDEFAVRRACWADDGTYLPQGGA